MTTKSTYSTYIVGRYRPAYPESGEKLFCIRVLKNETFYDAVDMVPPTAVEVEQIQAHSKKEAISRFLMEMEEDANATV